MEPTWDVVDRNLKTISFTLVLGYAMMPVAKIGARTWALDPFLTYMKAAAPLTAVDGQVITFAEVTGRLVPEVQGDTMFVCGTAFFIEDLAASGIGARENQLRSRHRDQPSCFKEIGPPVMRSHDVNPIAEYAGLLNRNIIAVFGHQKRIGIREFQHAIELVNIHLTLPSG